MFNWHIKEKPILSLLGMGGGIGSKLVGGGGGSLTVTGGDVEYEYNGNKFHIFTSSGALSLDASPTGPITFNYVLIGGGGGGGAAGGGGGAGGVISNIPGIMPVTRTPLSMDVGQSVTVTIGNGGPVTGAGQPNSPAYPGGQQGGNGYDTFFTGPGGTSTRALGGGGGGAEANVGPANLPVPASSGGRGGSGGGGRAGRNEASPSGGLDNQGNTGSEAAGSPQYPPGIAGGGGGGAGGPGTYGEVNVDGGPGIQLPTTFRNPSAPAAVKGDPAPGAPSPGGWYFAGGGGGYTDNVYPIPAPRGGPLGIGGYGGGGQGNEFRDPNFNATSGQANTGSGGGGDGAPGGSGIAFFYYPIS